MKKKSLSVLAKSFTTFCLLFYSFAPSVLAIDNLIPEDKSQDILATGISDPSWIIDDDTATTADVVLLNQTYIAPQDSNVSVTFTKLPSLTSKLTITKVFLTDEEVIATNASSNIAYDISTDMADGTFEYDLTLPNVNNSSKVLYAENRSDLVNNTRTVDNTIVDNGNTLKIENLNHFTIYIVTTAGNTPTVSSGTVNDASSVTVLPSASITVKLKVTIDNGESWKSTSYKIGNNQWACVDTTDQSGNGTYDGSFVISAPSTDGTYNLSLRTYSRNCNASGGVFSEVYTMSNAIVVDSYVSNVTNPTLAQACGLDIALVLDVSGSIDSAELTTMKNAFKGLVDALSGTPTRFSVIKFDTTATVLQTFTNDFTLVKSKIDSASGGNYTNWEDGLVKAQSTYSIDRLDKPNLVIFASDGNPNRIGNGTSATESLAVSNAVIIANQLKTAGTRILALGIGNDLNTTNLKAISGPNMNGSMLTSDVITTNFASLASQLASFASQTCGGKISVNKYVDNVQQSAGQTWSFSIDNGTAITTDANGQVASNTLSVGSHTISETSIPTGYTFDHATCTNGTYDSTIKGVKNISITADSIITCNFYNTTNKGSITIIKDALPDSAQDFSFTTTGTGISDFSLDDDSDATLPNTKVFSNLMPGAFSVTEASATGWDLTNLSCSTGGTSDLVNKTANIVITPGLNVTCTFTNTQQKGHIIVDKVTLPTGSTQSFLFTTTGAGYTNFSLTDTATPNDQTLNPGTYSVSESVVSGWDQTSATCSDGSPVSAINLSAGETVTCTFVNTQRGTISGYKLNDSDGDYNTTNDRTGVSGWTIELWQNDILKTSAITANDGSYTFSNVIPGTYQLREAIQVGWYKIYPTGNTLTVNIDPGQSSTDNNFINVKYPSIKIIKNVDTNGDGTIDQYNATDWQWNINGSGNYQTGNTVLSLTPNTYTISEVQKANYHVTDITCNNGITYSPSESITASLVSGQDLVCTFTNTRDTGTLRIVKTVTNNNGGNKHAENFAFQIDSESPIQFDATGVYEITRYAGLTYNITETSHDGYAVSYTNCSNVLVSKDSVSTCTITNDDIAPSLTLVKSVTNDNGGKALPSAWTLTATGPTTISGQGTVSSDSTFKAGTYTLSESNGPEGYQASTWSCTGIQNNGNQITLDLGQRAICTIVNDDIAPSVTLYKHVTKDNGGVAGDNDFGLSIGSTSVVSGQTLAVAANTPVALNEVGLKGYNFVSITGEGCPTNLGGTVTLLPGQNISCTINNDDIAPSLTLIKEVTRNNGGKAQASDWTLTATGTTTISGQGTVSSGSTFKAGTYTLSESNGPKGYSTTGWNCTGVQNNGNQITLNVGDSAVCTIVNSDIAPTITLYKNVNHDNGGNATANDFGLTIGGTNVTSGQTLAVTANAPIALNETELAGYRFVSITGDNCPTTLGSTITLTEGQDIVCTINNDDIAPSLTLNKVTVKDNGGTAQSSDWTLTANGPTTISGQGTVSSDSTFKVGTYTLSESNGPEGYLASNWVCTGVQNDGNQITLGLGQSAVCTITNDDIAPSLTLVKSVTNNNGGKAQASDWTLTATGPTTISGQGTVSSVSTFLAGTYTLSESNGPEGYSNNGWSCTGVTNTGNQITLGVGDSATCTIVNDDIAPTIKLYKNVDINYGGTASPSDFDLLIGSTHVKSGDTLSVEANIPISLSENPLDGYTFVSITGEGCPTTFGGTVTLLPGQNITCTINNTDLPGTITIYKHVLNSDYQDDDIYSNTEFGIVLNGDQNNKKYISDTKGGALTATFSNLSAGEYTLTEDEVQGFNQLGCYIPDHEGSDNSFTLHNGENLNIICENQAITPVLEISKTNDTAGLDKYAGDKVTYTITVTAPSEDNGGDYIIKNAKVSDILPKGFAYLAGTWKAVSSLRGDITGSITSEPVYGTTPAVWTLGDLTEGEVVTLTYTAQISSAQDPGLYKDIAWTYGQSLIDETVLGNADSGIFVGTQVNVVALVEEGEVLGITDYVGLPDTGANTTFTIAAISSFLLGALLLILGSKKKMKYFGTMLISVFGLLTFTKMAYAETPDIIVHIEQPASPTNQTSFKVGYVAADLLGRDLQVQCYETTKGAFGPAYTTNNGDCLVDNSIITADGTYEFYVTVTVDSSTVTSDKVKVVVDNTTPSPVTEYTKTVSGCSNVLQFTTANDGQTSQVQIFRSDKASFTASSSNLIATLNVNPNQTLSYTDTPSVCGTYYYAIRAVDNAENVSTFVTDRTVVLVTIPASNTNTTQTSSSEEVKGSETTDSSSSTTIDTNTDTTSDNTGEVKGASSEVAQTNPWVWIKFVLIAVGVIGIMSIAYIYVNKRVNQKNSK